MSAPLGQEQRVLLARLLAYTYLWLHYDRLQVARRLERRGLVRIEDDGVGSRRGFITQSGRSLAQERGIVAEQGP